MEDLRVKLIGCGGIGGHLAPNLCRFLYARRCAAHIVLVDGDQYEERNRERMRFTELENKAFAMARELADSFGDLLTFEPFPEYATGDNVHALIAERDYVFLSVDNHATRHLVDGRCAALRDIVLISGGNDGITDGSAGTYGNVQIVRRSGGRYLTGSLGRFHPEIREPQDELPSELGCVELAQAGAPQLLFTNLAVASAMLNGFYAVLQDQADYEEVYLDIIENRLVPVRRPVP